MDLSRKNFLKGGDELGGYGNQHKESAEMIRKALVKHGFTNAGLNDAIWLWGEYSESVAAGWVGGSHPLDVEYYDNEDQFLDSLFECVRPYIRKEIYPNTQ